jgi:glycosyltransferase involved in cell wall biosynthesis
MPAYNAGRFLNQSINSVLHQTYMSWELLVVDDGSTDNTKTVIQSFCEKDKRIKYHYQKNGKQGKARNTALQHAKGVYIAFIDADDTWLPGKLEQQVADINEKNVALVFSDAYMFTGDEIESTKLIGSGKGFFSGREGMKSFLEMNRIPTFTVFAKAVVLRQVGGFTESPEIPQAEDYHLWLKLLMNGFSFYGSPSVLGAYRIHPHSSSSEDKLAVRYVVEALEDLKLNYTSYKKMLNNYQKKWFNRYHYSTNHWNNKDYKDLIKKNCTYLKKKYLISLFNAMYFLTGITVTRKIMTRLINY